MKYEENWQRKTHLLIKRWWRHHPQSRPVMAFFVAVGAIGVFANFPTKHYVTSWKGNHWSQPVVSGDRTPASSEQCESGQLKLSDLQQENIQLESAFPKRHDLHGRWLHLDLAKLSFPAARLLQRLPEEKLRPYAVTIASCGDIACIYNLLSNDADKEYGALAWNWFLKTGVALQWSEQETAFTKEELKKLHLLSEKLTPDFFHQSSLLSLEKTALPEGQCVKSQNGKVRISINCASDLETLVTTGMSEVLLPMWIEQFPEWKQTLTRSSQGEWKNKQWQQSKTNFKSFAPAVAQFVLSGTTQEPLNSLFKEHLKPRDWSLEGDMKRQFKRDQWVWRDVKNKFLKDCLDLHQTALVQPKRTRGIASLSEPHPMAQCLRQTAVQNFISQKRIWLTQSYSRSCEWNRTLPSGHVPTEEYLSYWEKLVNKDVDQLEWRMRADGPSWLREYQAREASLAAVDPTWVYFNCHQSVDPKGCYQQGFSDLLRQEGRAPSSVQDEIIDEYPFEALEARVSEDVGMKRQWYLHRMEEEATRAWRQCWREGPNEMVKPYALKIVTPGTEFLDGRFANCLENSSKAIMNKLAPGDKPESSYWRAQLEAPLKSWWKSQIASEADKERVWLMQKADSIKDSLAKDLKGLMARGPAFNPKQSCLTRLTYHYPTRMYFHDRQQLNSYLGVRICNEVLSSEDMKKSLTQHQQNRWKLLGKDLQAAVVPKWEDRVRRFCLGRVPASQAQALLQTDAVKGCMREQFEMAWPEASEKIGQRYSMPSTELEEFKADIELLSQAALNSNLKK